MSSWTVMECNSNDQITITSFCSTCCSDVYITYFKYDLLFCWQKQILTLSFTMICKTPDTACVEAVIWCNFFPQNIQKFLYDMFPSLPNIVAQCSPSVKGCRVTAASQRTLFKHFFGHIEKSKGSTRISVRMVSSVPMHWNAE